MVRRLCAHAISRFWCNLKRFVQALRLRRATQQLHQLRGPKWNAADALGVARSMLSTLAKLPRKQRTASGCFPIQPLEET